MRRIARGIEHSQRGEHSAAREVFADVWAELGSTGDALHRCAVAHSMADVQEDARDELMWDLRALAAASELTDERIAASGSSGTVRGFYPSLHLNLADVYCRLGEWTLALDHVRLGLAALAGLPADGYFEEIRRSLERVGGHVDGAAAMHRPTPAGSRHP